MLGNRQSLGIVFLLAGTLVVSAIVEAEQLPIKTYITGNGLAR